MTLMVTPIEFWSEGSMSTASVSYINTFTVNLVSCLYVIIHSRKGLLLVYQGTTYNLSCCTLCNEFQCTSCGSRVLPLELSVLSKIPELVRLGEFLFLK